MRLTKGLFVTFEGIEGSGKSTQVQIFCSFLDSLEIDYVRTVEPGGTSIGGEIRKILLSVDHSGMIPLTELLLYAASRAQHMGELIKPSIEKGLVVVCDRFFDSTLAYQGFGREIDLTLIEQLNDICIGGIRPDLTFLLELDVRAGLMRNRNAKKIDRLEMETIEFHEKVRKGYHEIARRDPQRVKIVDSSGAVTDIARDIQSIFLDFVKDEGYAV